MVDTPGHVDFSFEVRRSLAAVQGAVLLVDSTQGVQAQTVANYRLAVDRGLVSAPPRSTRAACEQKLTRRARARKVVPCLTKLDLKTSDPAACLPQMEAMLGIKEADVLWTSARTREGVDAVLDAVVERVPSPPSAAGSHALGEVVDMWHDQFRGVVVLVAVRGGVLRPGDRLEVAGVADSAFEVKETGVFLPHWCPVPAGLAPGRVGYVLAVNAKGARGAYVGAVVVAAGVAGVHRSVATAHVPKPAVFASLYPTDAASFDDLKKAVTRLALNDASVAVALESSTALGQGFRVGFLGLLHMDVFIQRLEDEFGTSLIATAPSVGYKVELKDGTMADAQLPSQLPDRACASHACLLACAGED